MKRHLVFILQFVFVFAFSQETFDKKYLNEARFVKLNGIEQWITITGDKTKPVILFVHGGPGNPMSPFAENLYGKWKSEFLLVQWDQRGSGKTYGYNAPDELSPAYLRSNPLSVELMTTDGIALARYLIEYLRKDKLILAGTSWGSVLAIKMAGKNPELFHAYLGHSQMVNPDLATFKGFELVTELATEAKDKESLDMLKTIGKPPYESAKHTGMLLKIIKKYQERNAIPGSSKMFEVAPEYNNEKDNFQRSEGEDYSFVSYAGDKRLGVDAMSRSINLLNDDVEIKIPVYFVQGKEDIQTPEFITREYFEKLKAPEKKLVVVPDAAHGFNDNIINSQYNLLRDLILPKLNKH